MRNLSNKNLIETKTLECEVRGCITMCDFNEIKTVIEQDWGKLDESPELVIFFKNNYDLRLKINKHGCSLILKKTIDKKIGIRKEAELKFKLNQIPNAINFLNQLGNKQGLFSYCHRFNGSKNNQNISIKFNTRIGDLFEIEQMVEKKSDYKKIHCKLTKLVAKYGLKIWSQQIYQQIIEKSWKNVMPEPLLKNNTLHPLIKKIVSEINKGNKSKKGAATSIASILKQRSNDYSALEYKFKKKSLTDLLSCNHSKINNYNERVSIIIPSYNSINTLKLTLKSLELQKLHPKQKSLIEVIVIDDGSIDGTENMLKKQNLTLNLRYIKQNNLGRVYARNLGASMAQGKILIFIDSDIVLENHFLNEHILRHHYLENIVLLGFKQNISATDEFIQKFLKNKNQIPDITKDFRFEKTVKKSWLRMHRHVRHVNVRNVKIIKESNNLKNFGKDRILGVWDLPSIIVTNAISLKKDAFFKVGGFNLQFKGWGMEDTFLGACLIAANNYVIPCFSTGVFHIKHPNRSGSQLKKFTEFNRNVLVYLDLINKPLNKVFKQPPALM